jgi:hypothetical protein
MMALILSDVLRPEYILENPWTILPLAFQFWMLIDAIRRQEYFWAFFIFLFPVINAVIYFFLVYRAQPSATQGFELPGAYKRKRIKELQGLIHHLDKAHHYAELGDIYFQQGKLQEAEKCYREALVRDDTDPDFHAHLGQCLLRQGRAEEAKPLLQRVLEKNQKHDYGHTMMAYAETLANLGDKDSAIEAWKLVLEHNSYARARVQLSELYLEKGAKAEAKELLEEFLQDATYTASFQQRKDRPWINKAKKLIKLAR